MRPDNVYLAIAFDMGFTAKRCGSPITDNPYHKSDERFQWWRLGWRIGSFEGL